MGDPSAHIRHRRGGRPSFGLESPRVQRCLGLIFGAVAAGAGSWWRRSGHIQSVRTAAKTEKALLQPERSEAPTRV